MLALEMHFVWMAYSERTYDQGDGMDTAF